MFAFVRVVVVVDTCISVFIGVFIFTGVTHVLISVFVVSTGTLAVFMGPHEVGGWVVMWWATHYPGWGVCEQVGWRHQGCLPGVAVYVFAHGGASVDS